jgi:hypothetical protein
MRFDVECVLAPFACATVHLLIPTLLLWLLLLWLVGGIGVSDAGMALRDGCMAVGRWSGTESTPMCSMAQLSVAACTPPEGGRICSTQQSRADRPGRPLRAG